MPDQNPSFPSKTLDNGRRKPAHSHQNQNPSIMPDENLLIPIKNQYKKERDAEDGCPDSFTSGPQFQVFYQGVTKPTMNLYKIQGNSRGIKNEFQGNLHSRHKKQTSPSGRRFALRRASPPLGLQERRCPLTPMSEHGSRSSSVDVQHPRARSRLPHARCVPTCAGSTGSTGDLTLLRLWRGGRCVGVDPPPVQAMRAALRLA